MESGSNSLTLLSKLQDIKKLQFLALTLNTKVFILTIRCTLNNFYIVVSDYFGKLLVSQSSGSLKLSTLTKKAGYRFELALLFVLKQIKILKKQHLLLKLDANFIKKKRFILKTLAQFNFTIIGLQLDYWQAFNGVRLKKRRRL